MKLISKTIIKGTIKLETGLHIGGSKSSLDIGGLDSPVIKNPLGVPYIPGSSLKGKLRSLLAAKYNTNGNTDEHDDATNIKKIFGYAGKNKKGDAPSVSGEITRLIVRDADLDVKVFNEIFKEDEAVLETPFTQEKTENRIDRKSGKAANGGIRNIERVPAGAIFNFELVLNNYEEDKSEDFIGLINTGFELLEDDYLGGSGSRGYGKIKIESNINNPETKSY
jgi:CRISPR-associated protein Csm3